MNTLTSTDTGVSGRLPHMGVLRFAGPDAATFLQGQVSNDTLRLSAGAPLLAAYSTPQGRVIAVFHLLPHSSGLLAVLPREIVLPTLERLRKYVLRAKVTIEDLSEQFTVFGRQAAAADAVDAFASVGLPTPGAGGYAERAGVGVARMVTDPNRDWVVGSVNDIANQGISDDAEAAQRAEHAWRLADIRSGSPQIYAATREMFVAQMLNLDLIGGISFSKGCFTGQEIIARTQHLGRIKRRLFRLRLPGGTWALGQTVTLGDGRTGRLTEVARVGTEFEALAVLSIEAHPPDSKSAAGPEADSDAGGTVIDATELPLPYPLNSA